jgi:hypothetical protein
MSKYVRLKDGTICDGTDNYKIDEEGNYCEIVSRWGKNEEVIMIPKDCVEKESDNIEDLFDVYVTVFDTSKSYYKNIFPRQYLFLQNAINDLPKIDEIYNPQIYGAIWTDKGLIYVARMNANEEWELI